MSIDNAKRTKIIDRVKGLLAKTVENGCTEAEAMEAAKKVGQIMDGYNLAMSEIDVREEAQQCETDYFDTGSSRNNPGVYILSGIEKFFGVKTWISRKYLGRELRVRYAYFGMPADVSGAKFLTTTLLATMERETAAYLKKHGGGRTAGTAFREAFASRVAVRLIDLAGEREVAARRSTFSTALVELKDQLVDQKYRGLALKFHGRAYQASGGRDWHASAAGACAGERASFAAGIESSSISTRALPAA